MFSVDDPCFFVDCLVPPGPPSEVGSSAAAFAAPLRNPGRCARGFQGQMDPNLSLEVLMACVLQSTFSEFIKSLHKTNVFGLGFMTNPLKTNVWCISCRKDLTKTCVQPSL